MFSVALATVLFPTLSRFAARRDLDGLRATMATGVRQIFLLLIPAAAFTLVLATPIVRLVFQHGAFGAGLDRARVRRALFWFSFSLPFAGVNLLLTRTFFSLQRPWIPTALAAGNLVVNARRQPRALQAVRHRRPRDRHRGGERRDDARPGVLPAPRAARAPRGRRARSIAVAQMIARRRRARRRRLRRVVAARRGAGPLDPAQIVSVGAGRRVAGFVVYAAAVLMLRIPEARQGSSRSCSGRLRGRRA